MSNKNTARELALTIAENLGDEILFKAANTFLEDAIKSIPFASLISGLIQTYTKFRTLKEQKQLLAFIQETEINSPDFINNFFKDKNNTELGLEIISILDQTYLEKQARMIGRVAILFKNLDILKQEFDKYTYIITRLNNHLILLIDELYTIETNRDDPEFEFDISNANMEFVSFQFLIEVPSPLNFDGQIKISRFKRTDSFYYFYENIFKD